MKLLLVLDNGGVTWDRYTVFIQGEKEIDMYGMSDQPNRPDGFNQYVGAVKNLREANWGDSKVNYNKLNPEVQKAIRRRQKGYIEAGIR